MENECKWYQNALMSELTEGMELTKQLNTHLINLSASSIHPQQFHLLQNILSSYQKALHILQPLQSSSPNVTPTHDDHHRHSTSKKRKMSTNQVRTRSESGLECPSEDGYSWRKYGQKDILAAKFPRSYYRCTYRNVQGCRATKQVQRSDEDPSLFDITYKGKHTCNRHRSPTPRMQEINHHHHMHQQQINNETLLNLRNNLRVEMQEIDHHHMQQQQQEQEHHINNETLLNLRNNLRVDTHNNEHNTMEAHFPFPSTSFDPFSTLFVDDNLLGGLSKFLSPDTDTSEYSNNYFPTNSCERNGFNDLSEIISANTSVSNSPVVIYDLDFSNEPAELGSFTFDDYNCNWN